MTAVLNILGPTIPSYVKCVNSLPILIHYNEKKGRASIFDLKLIFKILTTFSHTLKINIRV